MYAIQAESSPIKWTVGLRMLVCIERTTDLGITVTRIDDTKKGSAQSQITAWPFDNWIDTKEYGPIASVEWPSSMAGVYSTDDSWFLKIEN